MKRFFSFWKRSAEELHSIHTLTLAAVLTAIYAVTYSPFAGNVVIVPGLVELRFGFLVIAVAAMLFGPVVGMLVAVMGDFLGTIFFYGGSFFFGYPVSWAMMGLIFGLFLYKERVSIPRIIGATLATTLVVNQALTPLWQSMMGLGRFDVLFVTRIPRNLIMLPVNAILLLAVLRGVQAIYRRVRQTT